MERLLSPKPEIRRTTFDDIPSMRAMHAQSWRDTYPNESAGVSKEWIEERTAAWLTPERLEESKTFMKDALTSPFHFHHVAVAGDQVVGMIHASSSATRHRLEALYIDKKYQGTGLAQELMAEFLKWSVAEKPIILELVEYNARAQAFYEKFGFEVDEASEHLFVDKIPVVNMIRKGDKQ